MINFLTYVIMFTGITVWAVLIALFIGVIFNLFQKEPDIIVGRRYHCKCGQLLPIGYHHDKCRNCLQNMGK